MSGRLQDRVALVTGSARGIGRAVAEELAREGATVGILDLKQERVDGAVAELTKAGYRAAGFAGDVSDRAVLAGACKALMERYGRFDILVSNAMWARYEPLAAITAETMDRMLGVGFKAVVWGMQIAAELMGPSGRGAVINIGSIAALRSLPNSMLYSGIKAGIGGLTRSGAVDLGPMGIRVNAIAPGTTQTEGVVRNVSKEGLEHRLARTPLGRLGTVTDIAKAAVYLASDESAWVNGATLVVDGGIAAAHL